MSQEQWPTGHPLEAVIAMVETLAAEQKVQISRALQAGARAGN